MRRVDHPRFRAALEAVESSIAASWAAFCAEHDASGPDLAEIVLQNPAEFEWRVVDAALDQLTCAECGIARGAGPVECTACEFANGLRYGAIEIDRPNVPPGNEHAIRVSSAVARTRHRYLPRVRAGYEIALPDLLDGKLPTTAQAQAGKAILNRLSDDELEAMTELP
ncbi:hypothetical protein [Tenggerimyces flavus]|uniref:Uncharacterized protein n=1 Tax=Tenggerimyces flavus TaxID=1708749 RepID=A0ABV7YPZ6_9ACTN|nr:hypothetical protein [Tenggerimyces flavus]MBM7785795.1 hypothetical protein [Tenggerimyces flavus]